MGMMCSSLPSLFVGDGNISLSLRLQEYWTTVPETTYRYWEDLLGLGSDFNHIVTEAFLSGIRRTEGLLEKVETLLGLTVNS